MIGIVIPAHNEEELLADCLQAARMAAAHPALRGETVRIVVALDSCTDRSASIARCFDTHALMLEARNVGKARAAGAAALVAQGVRWLAFTDADSRVAADWLVAQLALGAEAVCGPVIIEDWRQHDALTRDAFYRAYLNADGHRHVHGANLGVSTLAYCRAGGFPPLACSEDVALVGLLVETGARIAWSAAPRVVTSARLASRVRGGFGDTLAALGRR
ncbi:glycosyltransferase [Paraburkholderia sp. LEh10]|jgi:glycosyltransferase involved in cell wall biosynthesis|uniref:glycosyltransferase n=1 Tax=Paraburkholderia sp. LEh10 TaxID=2821353 RepID=UPI001AE9ECBB|nr:glycosyltransferase [Paraburkholderia sp. LEh10]MBP0590102.1 glycosyltransferase [Paraburkholderia sp. LEh10]